MQATLEAVAYVPNRESNFKEMNLKKTYVFDKRKCLIVKKKIKAELLKLNCTEIEAEQLLTEDVIKEAIRNEFSAEAVAWALIQ